MPGTESIKGSLGTARWINQSKAGLNKAIVFCSERGEVSVSFIPILARFWYRLHRVCTVQLKGHGMSRVWAENSQGLNRRSQESANKWHFLKFRWGWSSWTPQPWMMGIMPLCQAVDGMSWVSSQCGEQADIHRDLGHCKLRNGPPGPAGSSPNQVYSAWRTKHQRKFHLLSSTEHKGIVEKTEADSPWRKSKNLQIPFLTTDTPVAYPGKGISHWIGKALEHMAQEGWEISTRAGFSKLSWTWPWATWCGFEVRPALSRRLGTVTSRGPSNPNYSMMLWKNSRMNAALPLEDVPSALRGMFEVDGTAVFQIAALVLWTRRSQLPSIQQLLQTHYKVTEKAIFKRNKTH